MKSTWRLSPVGWLLLTLALVSPLPAPLKAQAGQRVALVVRFDDETVVTRCIHFTEAQISGYEVLERSDLDIVANFSGMGAAICKIEETGCPADNCFCESPTTYWSYWHLEGETWVYSQAGVSAHQVSDGDVEGWSWGAAPPAPVIAFEEICTPPATDTPTPTSTATATSTPTATPVPTLSPTVPPPTATPRPSVQFWVDADTVAAGTCTTVHWITQQIQAVRLNGQDVPATGTRSVCPCDAEMHRLQVIYPNGREERLSVTVSVTGSCAATSPLNTPTVAAPTSTSQPTPSPQPTVVSVAQPTATLTSSPAPSATPSPLPTSMSTPTPSPLLALTNAAPPTATATRTPLPTVMPIAAPRSRATLPPSYAIFGVIAGGLLVGLFVFVQRQG